MDDRKRLKVIITVILSLVSLGLMVTSFATDNWISATAGKNESYANNTGRIPKATLSFGLFRGQRTIDYGNGVRDPQDITVVCDGSYCTLFNTTKLGGYTPKSKLAEIVNLYQNQTVKDELYKYGLFPFALWVVVLLMVSLGMVWVLVYVGFACFNICGKPIETITGQAGLFLWKGLALLFSLLGMIVYLVLYFNHYQKSVMPYEDIQVGFKSTANLDFSFYMLMAGVIALAINMVLLLLSGVKMSCGFTREAEKVMDNGIILY